MANLNGDIQLFKSDATKFYELDKRIKEITDAIKPLTDELRSLKNEKSTLKREICNFMSNNSLEQCSLKDCNSLLVYRKRKILIPVTKDTIREDLKKFFITIDMNKFNKLDSNSKAEMIFKFIYEEEREYKFSEVLQNKFT